MAKELNKNELTKEQIEKAMACKTADELMAMAEAEGYELTKDEAEAYMAELAEVELGDEVMEKAAGGLWYIRPSDWESTPTCRTKTSVRL